MTDREIKEFVRDRDKAVKETIEKQDLDVFKGFYVRYMLKGVYREKLPKDEILWLSLYKMLFHMTSSTHEEKAIAAEWLYAHGSSPDLKM